MGTTLVVAVTVAYAVVAVLNATKGNWGGCIVFAGYAFANIGIIMTGNS